MFLQVISTKDFFSFTDVLIRGGLDNAQLLVNMARAIGGIAAFLYISKRIYEQLIADNPISPFAPSPSFRFGAGYYLLGAVCPTVDGPYQRTDQTLRSGLCR